MEPLPELARATVAHADIGATENHVTRYARGRGHHLRLSPGHHRPRERRPFLYPSLTTFLFPIICRVGKKTFVRRRSGRRMVFWQCGAFFFSRKLFSWSSELSPEWSSEKGNGFYFHVPVTTGGFSALRSIVLCFFVVDCFDPQKHERRC